MSDRHAMRARRVAIAICVAGLCGALAWRLWPKRVEHATTVVPVAAGREPAFELPARMTSPTVQYETAVAAAPASAPTRIEICGIGTLEKTADVDEETLTRGFEDHFEGARDALAARLVGNADPFTKASGLVVQAAAEIHDQRKRSGGEEACQYAYCPLTAAVRAREAQLADQLAAMAATSADPRLYALAIGQCRTADSSAQCARLSPRQWARLDPGNAAPWLEVLGEATRRHDTAAIDDALFQMARASRQQNRYFAVTAEISRHAGGDDQAQVAAYMAAMGTFGTMAMALPSVAPLATACRGAALDDSNRRQLCDDIAHLLTEHADTVLLSMIGTSIGKRLGWPVERIDELRGLQEALAAWATPDPAIGNPSSCRAMRGWHARFIALDELGELGVTRGWLRSTGRSADTFTAKARAKRLRLEQAPPAEASSAPERSASSPS